MAIVQLTISALPAHVRTARLMATAVARRAGIAESALDEVRLAVGEACSRAVEAHREHCPNQPIQLELIDSGGPRGGRRLPPSASGANGGSSVGRGSADSIPAPSARFEVVVADRAPSQATAASTDIDHSALLVADGHFDDHTPPGGVSGLSPDVGLAVIVGLADQVNIEPHDTGTIVRMSWPVAKEGVAPEGTSGK